MTIMSPSSANPRPLPAVIGLIGTIVVCAAALVAHLSPPVLKPVAQGLWILGLMTQAGAFAVTFARLRRR